MPKLSKDPETQKLEEMYHSVAEKTNRLQQEIDAQNYVLKPLEPNVISNTINANSHTKKHLNDTIVEKSHEGIDFLVKQGLSIFQAMGIIANGIAENGLSVEKNSGGLGIFQWIGKRAENYRKMYSKLPGANDFEKQLSYMLYELGTTEKKAFSALQSAKTPEAAARAILVHFERPKKLNFDTRQGLATGLRNLLKKIG